MRGEPGGLPKPASCPPSLPSAALLSRPRHRPKHLFLFLLRRTAALNWKKKKHGWLSHRLCARLSPVQPSTRQFPRAGQRKPLYGDSSSPAAALKPRKSVKCVLSRLAFDLSAFVFYPNKLSRKELEAVLGAILAICGAVLFCHPSCLLQRPHPSLSPFSSKINGIST